MAFQGSQMLFPASEVSIPEKKQVKPRSEKARVKTTSDTGVKVASVSPLDREKTEPEVPGASLETAGKDASASVAPGPSSKKTAKASAKAGSARIVGGSSTKFSEDRVGESDEKEPAVVEPATKKMRGEDGPIFVKTAVLGFIKARNPDKKISAGFVSALERRCMQEWLPGALKQAEDKCAAAKRKTLMDTDVFLEK
jgi:hypothetical protein